MMRVVLVSIVVILAHARWVSGRVNGVSLQTGSSNGRQSCGVGHLTCCSGKVYHPPRELCCVAGWRMPGQIRRAPFSSSLCCGNSTYDARYQLCCDGVARRRSTVIATGCCGTKLYALSTKTCCGNKLYPKPRTFGMACCGNKMFSHRRLICCNGVLHPASPDTMCCRRSAYNRRRDICCNGHVHRRRRLYNSCCGKDICRQY